MKNTIITLILLVLSSCQLVWANKPDVKINKKAEKWIEKTLKNLSLREKIGQMIMVRMLGDFTNLDSEQFSQIRKNITDDKLGGFIIARGDANAIAVMTNELQKISAVPLLFAADYERGLRMQMRTGTPFTWNMGVAATGDPQAAYRQGKIIATEMRAIGVNWLFAPVADINNNPDNPVINVRSYGENPQRVAEFVTAFANGVRDGNVLSTLKHFPGHGDTAVDSHIGLATITADKKRLETIELVPFKIGIQNGIETVMTAHVAVPNVAGDEIPATINQKISTDILRKELNFNGIISTDAMEMGAIVKNYSEEKSVVMAVKAGADVVLLPLDTKKTIDAIEAAVKSGELTEARIDQSVQRLLAAKYKLGLTESRFVDVNKVMQLLEKPENVREANATAEKSITLLRNDDAILPMNIEKARKTLFVIVAADEDPEEGRAFVPEILKRASDIKVVRIDLRSNKEDYEKTLAQALNYENLIIVPFVKRAASKGTVALPEKQAEFIRQTIALQKPIAVVAFGNPYLIRQFPAIKNYVVTYSIEEIAQMATVKTLFGEIPFQGKLPVSIPGIFELGTGLTSK